MADIKTITDINGVTYDLRDATAGTLVLDIASFSSLPLRVPSSGTNSAITSDLVVVNSVLGTPSAQTGDWTVTTNAGYLEVAGTISGSTTLKLYLLRER